MKYTSAAAGSSLARERGGPVVLRLPIGAMFGKRWKIVKVDRGHIVFRWVHRRRRAKRVDADGS